MNHTWSDDLTRDRGLVDAALEEWLPPADTSPSRLHEAMRYAVFAGGKRLRPVLVLQASRACGGTDAAALPAAAAVEMIHTYSLVHDDLPAMDDDSLRRGKPTTHVVYGEALAVLVGDALLTRAFEILTTVPEKPSLAVAAELARAAGSTGMIGGQVLDLDAEGRRLASQELEGLHLMKTGALLAASVLAGGHCAGASPAQLEALRRYGERIGLAFQIMDDVLDVTGSGDSLGKSPGKDARAGKPTFASLLGLDGSRQRALELSRDAEEAVTPLGEAALPLRRLARFVVERTS